MGEMSSSDDCGDMQRYCNNSEKQDHSDSTLDTSDSNSREGHAAGRIGTLDNGTTAFMRWLDSVNKQHSANHSLDIPIILRKFIKDKRTILYDKNLESEIDIEIKEGIPFCRYCNLGDCLHVGFTILLEQMCEDFSSNQELSIDDIVGS
jgi:hypothetical protein